MLLPGFALVASASPATPGLTTTPPMPNGWLARYLLDPAGFTSTLVHHVLDALAHVVRVVGPPVAIAVVVLVTGRLALARWQGARRRRGARFVAVLPPPEVDAAGAESLWRNLAGQLRPGWRGLLRGRPHVSFELVWSGSGVRFGVWLPVSVPASRVEHAIQAAWPGAATTTDAARAPLPRGGTMLGGELRLADREWFPIRTDLPADPYRMLLGAAVGLGLDDSAVVQILARPAAGRRLRRCRRAARALRTGIPMTAVGKLLDLVQPGPVAQPPRLSDDPWRSADLRAIQAKAAETGWEVVVRYGVASPRTEWRERRRLATHARALTAAFALYDGRNRLTPHRLRQPAGMLAARSMRRGNLVSVPELAALAHLPLDVGVPGLVRAGARAVPPPSGVPIAGKVLGDAEAGPRRAVALGPADARHHVHVLGATGSGKSTLLTNLVLGDVAARRGAVVIDPKGDLVTDILDRLPASAIGRVVLIDPEESEAPPSLNVLEGPDAALAVDHLVGTFERIFAAYWGPRTDDVLRMACLTVLRRPGTSLADVPRLLTDARFRAGCVASVDDDLIRGFWAWYDALTPAGQAQVVGPVMSKLRVVLTRPFMADVVGSARSSFDMAADVLDGGLLLVRVPKGILGDETARLLGSFVVARVWQTITARSRAGEGARYDASLYVDECHNFLTLPRSLEDLLAEARGYRLSVVCAHQHLGQLPRELREAVSANARNKVFFSLSPEDARVLQRHVVPELAEHDLCHLGGYQAAARLIVGGQERPAFTLRTRPAPPPIPGRAEEVRASARARFGRSRGQRHQDALRRKLGGWRGRGVSGGGSAGVSSGVSPGGPETPGWGRAEPHVSRSISPADGEPDSLIDL